MTKQFIDVLVGKMIKDYASHYATYSDDEIPEVKDDIKQIVKETAEAVARDIKTNIGDYSAKSAKLAFNKCKEIIKEAGGKL